MNKNKNLQSKNAFKLLFLKQPKAVSLALFTVVKTLDARSSSMSGKSTLESLKSRKLMSNMSITYSSKHYLINILFYLRNNSI